VAHGLGQIGASATCLEFTSFTSLTRQRLDFMLKAQIPPVASAAGREAAYGRPLLFYRLSARARMSNLVRSPAPATSSSPRTFVYIDGFNLYFGALRGTTFRWLDLDAFCRVLLPKNDILKIRYFTARVVARPGNPDTAVRQQTYFRALATLRSVDVHLGHDLSHTRWMPLAAPGGGVMVDAGGRVQFAEVVREEEKGSDVNLAAHLMHA
jgi:hypothetical protein